MPVGFAPPSGDAPRWIGRSAGDAKNKCAFGAKINIERGALDPARAAMYSPFMEICARR